MAALDQPVNISAGLGSIRTLHSSSGVPTSPSQTVLLDYPFAEEKASSSAASTKDYVHIRIQQRNGRKSLTTVQGIKGSFDYKKILKALKKEYCCNGTVVEDEELGQVIQVQGDQRKNIADFLTTNKIVKKDLIKVHGF